MDLLKANLKKPLTRKGHRLICRISDSPIDTCCKLTQFKTYSDLANLRYHTAAWKNLVKVSFDESVLLKCHQPK